MKICKFVVTGKYATKGGIYDRDSTGYTRMYLY